MYVQYDSQGNISATVITSGAAPVCENQIQADDETSIEGMVVDIVNKVLISQPQPSIPTP